MPSPIGPESQPRSRQSQVVVSVIAVAVVLAVIVVALAALIGSSNSSNSDDTVQADWTGEERALLDDLDEAGLGAVLSEEEHIVLAHTACDLAETNYSQRSGDNTSDSIALIVRESGLIGRDVQVYWRISARHYCPRFAPPR